MNYCCAGEYELIPTNVIAGSMAASPSQTRLVRWHAVKITNGTPAARAVDGFPYGGTLAPLVADRDWERQHLMRCLDCAKTLGLELTGIER